MRFIIASLLVSTISVLAAPTNGNGGLDIPYPGQSVLTVPANGVINGGVYKGDEQKFGYRRALINKGVREALVGVSKEQVELAMSLAQAAASIETSFGTNMPTDAVS